MTGNRDPRRDLPSLHRLLGLPRSREWSERWGRAPVKRALRAALEAARERLGEGGGRSRESAPTEGELLEAARRRLEETGRPSLRAALNGTGVVLHTNLGRAPLAGKALAAVRDVAAGYSNLEYDLGRGERGSRHLHPAGLLCELSGAEGALVVNNNAAAVSLAVNELAREREVIVSRGELVEIGGSFRVPEVVERSGARLREVGTTNRTRIRDYREALGEGTGLLMKVHPSNYRLEGFTAATSLEELVALGREVSVPVLYDLGSGLLRPALLDDFPAEPSPGAALRAGADLVTWSGDKLLGGPQAGILLGREPTLRRLRSNPLLRAFRVDKMTLAALEATLQLYRDEEVAAVRVPAVRMLRVPAERVERRARAARDSLEERVRSRVRIRRMEARVGGGAFPGHGIPSAGWQVAGDPEELDARCRSHEPPLVGRIREGNYLIDFRTLLPGQEETVAAIVTDALLHAG